MIYSAHGGDCCGRAHLYNLPGTHNLPTLKDRVEKLRSEIRRHFPDHLTENYVKRKHGVVIEIVAAGDQIPKWDEALRAVGFKRVCTWRNSNSGNKCISYMQATHRLKMG